MLKIALVGAPQTGKSQLAAVLTGTLQTSACDACIVLARIPAPVAELASYDLTLLMGLEPPAGGPSQEGASKIAAQAREAADRSIRAALAHAGVPYRVIYGSDEERLAHALDAIEPLLKTAGKRLRRSAGAVGGPDSAGKARPWAWVCDKCSDPQCEHRLLSDLLAQRARTV